MTLMSEDIDLARQVILKLLVFYPHNAALTKRLYVLAIDNFETTDKQVEFQRYVEKNSFQKADIDFALTILLAHLPTEFHESRRQAIDSIWSDLEKHNRSTEVPDAKKVDSVRTFLEDNQERIVKLLLLFPNSSEPVSALVDTIRSHGFSRAQEKLEMLDFVSIDEITFLNQQLESVEAGEISAGFVLDLIALVHAFKDDSFSDQDQWKSVLQKKDFLKAREVKDELSILFLVNIARSIGLDEEVVASTSLESWDLKYMPRLIEAKKNFEQDEAFEVLFKVILKASFLQEFEQVISPEGKVDRTAYTDDELQVIDSIKSHNLLTRERFAERRLSLDAFRAGAERKLAGRITAEEIVLGGFEEHLANTTRTLAEVESLGFPASSTIVTNAKKVLDNYRRVYDPQNNSGLAIDLAAYYKQQESRNSTKDTRPTPTFSVETDTAKKVLGLIQSAFISNQIVVTGDQSINVERPNPELVKFLIKIFGNKKEVTKLFKEAFVNYRSDDGSIRYSREKITSGFALYTLLDALKNNRNTFLSQDKIEDALKLLSDFKPDQLPLAANATDRQENELEKPDLETGITEIIDSIQELTKQLLQVAGSQTTQVNEHSLKLQIDHLNTRLSELQELRRTVRNARTQDYDVTIRRWEREPGRDIFFGVKLLCCVAIESFNGYGMLQFLIGHDYECNEVIDNFTGEVVGGSFDFLSERIDSSPEYPLVAYVVDNIELNPSHQFIRGRVRDNVRKISKETLDRVVRSDSVGNLGVWLGTSYNDVPTGDLETLTVRSRKIGGPNLGIASYTDFGVQAERLGDGTLRLMTGYQQTPIYNLQGEPQPKLAERVQQNVDTFSIDLGNQAEKQQFARDHLQDLLSIEDSLFGLWSDSPEFQQLFSDEDEQVGDVEQSSLSKIVFSYALSQTRKLVGFMIGYPVSDEEIYVKTSSVDWSLHNKGIGEQLRSEFYIQAAQKGFKVISRDAMADTGYAQRLLRKHLSDGTLIEPSINTEDELNHFLDQEDSFRVEMGKRYQIHIKHRLNPSSTSP